MLFMKQFLIERTDSEIADFMLKLQLKAFKNSAQFALLYY